MIGRSALKTWVGLVCDGSSVLAFAARHTTVVAQHLIEFDLQSLRQSGCLPELDQFVGANRLKRCATRVAFSGPGTIVQRLTLPPLSARNRLRAVETHLGNYADGNELSLDLQMERTPEKRKSVRVLAAGVNRDLTRAIFRACRNAELCVHTITALASAFGPCANRGRLLQLVVGERTTTFQLFVDGQLIACRDILLGRRDFVQACQRPILTQRGPVRLTPEEAEALARTVGVPFGREDEVYPGMSARQLWPTLNPVLQRLQSEVEQSLTHSHWQDLYEVRLAVLGLPTIPGLDEFLVSEVHLGESIVPAERADVEYLAAVGCIGRSRTLLDLRPREERFAERMTRPALAVGLCGLLVVFANSFTPQQADAEIAALRPIAQRLSTQHDSALAKRIEMERSTEALAAGLGRSARRLAALPANVPVWGALKVVFGSLPADMELRHVCLTTDKSDEKLEIQAECRGQVAASIRAAEWARALSESALFSGVKVTGVNGSGLGRPATVELLLRIERGD